MLEETYVLVKFANSEKKDVIGEYDIVFLRKTNKMMNRYVKPEIEDRAYSPSVV